MKGQSAVKGVYSTSSKNGSAAPVRKLVIKPLKCTCQIRTVYFVLVSVYDVVFSRSQAKAPGRL